MIETTRRLICDKCGAPRASAGNNAKNAERNTLPEAPRSDAIMQAGAPRPEVLESESPRQAAEAEGWNCNDEDLCPACAAPRS